MTGNPTFDAVLNIIGGVSALLNIAGIALMVWFKAQYKKMLAQHQHGLDIKFAEHEAYIKAKHESEIQLLQNKLQQKLSENQIIFSNVYAKREEALKGLYSELRTALDACVEASASSSNYDQVESARAQMRAMHTKLEVVSIYFTEKFCHKWHKAVDDVATALSSLQASRVNLSSNWAEDRRIGQRAFEDCIAAFRNMTGDLKNEIRKLIGIE